MPLTISVNPNQPITIGSGDNQQIFSTMSVTAAQSFKSYQGTSGAPDTGLVPVGRVIRTQQVTSGIVGDGCEQLCAWQGHSQGTSSTQGQPVGVLGSAASASTQSSQNDDCCGLYGVGRVTGSGTGIGIGCTLLGRTDSTAGAANPLQAVVYNGSGSAGTYNSSGFSKMSGIWIVADGAQAGAAIVVGNPNNKQFAVGLAFNSQGTGGPILTSSIRDDSSSVTSLTVNGSHTTGIDLSGATITGGVVNVGSDVVILTPASGAPTNAVTGATVAGPGSLYVDTATGKWYTNTNTKASPTWTVVGAQS